MVCRTYSIMSQICCNTTVFSSTIAYCKACLLQRSLLSQGVWCLGAGLDMGILGTGAFSGVSLMPWPLHRGSLAYSWSFASQFPDPFCPCIQDGALPETLAQICNNMATNGSICQGFVYDSSTKTAFFKGSPQSTPVDTSKLCLNPKETAWLLKTGDPALLAISNQRKVWCCPAEDLMLDVRVAT